MFPRKKLPQADEGAPEASLLLPDLPSKASLVNEVGRVEQSRERLVDDSETTSDYNARNLAKPPPERVSTNRRLQTLEKCSMRSHNVHISTFEASELDLLSLIDKQEWKHVLRRIGSSPKSVSEKVDIELDGRQTQAFPLHLAVSKKPPANVVDAMVAVHPKACEIPDDTFGQLPLHIACKFRASTEVLKCILDSFPEATRLADTAEGRLPLHYACVDGYPFDISMLIAAGKRALTCKDASGKTPVDLVKESTSPHKAQVIKRILKVAKDDIKNSKRREAKEQQAPDTPLEPHPLDESMLAESLSELSDTTQVASNVRKMKKPTKKAKPILPSRVCRRKAKIDVDQSPVLVSNIPVEPLSFSKAEQKSSPSEPRTSHKKNRSREDLVPDMVSNEMEMKLSPNEPPTGHNDRNQENSVPDMVSNETEKKSSPNEASGLSSKDRKKNRRRQDSVSEVTSLLGPPKTMDLSSFPVAASSLLERSLNESILEDTKESISNTATTIPSQKKKGLATNTASIAFVGGEDNKSSFYEYGNNSDPSPLPLTASEDSRIGNSLPNLSLSPPLVSRDQMALETSHLDTTPSISAIENRIIQTEHFKESPHSRLPQSVPIPKASPNPFPNDSVIVALNAQLHSLELRKAALVDKCNHVSETILKKREKVQRDKGKLIEMKLKLIELEQLIDRQEEVVDFAESSITLQEQILSDHKDKIRAADQELTSLVNMRHNLIHEKDGGEMRSEAPSTSSSSASSADDGFGQASF